MPPTYLLLILLLVSQGCTAYSYVNKEATRMPQASSSNSLKGTPSRHITPSENQNGSQIKPFVGIAISGGGSRAAVFSAAVLENLDKIGILEHVSAISSVSGGSVAATYYSLYAPERITAHLLPNKFWKDFHKAMQKNFIGAWARRLYLPHNLFLRLTTNYDRSDVMAEVFDDEIFDGHTFEQLPKWNPRLLINATQVSDSERFVFTERYFKYLNSSLNDYPLSYAVMASASFPGIFNNVTLRDFEHQSYEHLFDGGNSDNLGITSLSEDLTDHLIDSEAASQIQMIRGEERPNQSNACLIILVDAQSNSKNAKILQHADTREGLGYAIDMTNISSAANSLFHYRRKETLQKIAGATDYDGNGGFFTEVHLETLQPSYQGSRPAICMVWHITFDRLLTLPEFWRSHRTCDLSGCNHSEKLSTKLHKRYYALANLASNIDTNFYLHGPKGCSQDELAKVLHDAARHLVLYDPPARSQINDWLRKIGKTSPQVEMLSNSLDIEMVATEERMPTGAIYDSLPLTCINK